MIYAAFLRAVNVGKANRISMDALRRVFSDCGLSGVRTYIQSGNVVFCADEPEEALRKTFENALAAAGLRTPVILRTAKELERLLADCPFSPDEIAQARAANPGESLYAVLFGRSPEAAAALTQNDGGARAVAAGRDVYLLLRQSIRTSPLAAKMGKIPEPATTRNFRTLEKMLSLARETTDKNPA
jgi:uncharacterized protein (DUF1697 family)